jgi:hypothetical protein
MNFIFDENMIIFITKYYYFLTFILNYYFKYKLILNFLILGGKMKI